MRRLEYQEGRSHKFWEIQVDGTDVTTRWGHMGTKVWSSPSLKCGPRLDNKTCKWPFSLRLSYRTEPAP